MTTQEQRLHFYAAFVFTKILKNINFTSMAKAAKKSKTKRPKEYNDKLAVNGSFLDIMHAAAKNANDKSAKKKS